MKKKTILCFLLLVIVVGVKNFNLADFEDRMYPPMLLINDTLYFSTEIATEEPQKNFQSNMPIGGAKVYSCIDTSLYENNVLFTGDLLVYTDEQYIIFESENIHHTSTINRISYTLFLDLERN